MAAVYSILSGSELLLLFVVVALGLLLGRVEVRGFKLGVAGVLFVGLALSAWLRPTGHLELAAQLKDFGLVVFVYCVGLTSGPGFFAAWRSRGLELNLAVLVALGFGALLTYFGGRLCGLTAAQIAGVFCGALTNTPALGAATDRLSGTAFEAQPALAYSLTYPVGVLGALLLGRGVAKLWRSALAKEIAERVARAAIESRTVEVTSREVIGKSVGELRIRDVLGVIVSRLRRGEAETVPTKYTVLGEGDVITVVGMSSDVNAAEKYFGKRSEQSLEARRDRVDMRRVLVSKREHAGKAIVELDLSRRFNAQVTRLRRADVDLVPSEDTRLELGDRLRVVAPVAQLRELARYLGDSERELAEVDYVALAVGLCAGLLLARLPLPLFGAPLTLGNAGGPLLASLILGRLGRTRTLTWAMPYEANLTLRELGLLLFLAGVGVNAGGKLAEVMNAEGLVIVALGAVVTLLTSVVAMLLMRRFAHASVVAVLGGASGLQTQPATLASAFEISERSPETYVAYALVYPLAMIGKILLAQLLVLVG
jgi:putative transport protein